MTGAIIVVGFIFPYKAADAAILWAVETGSNLRVLFVTADEVPSDSYPFPNDLEAAENEQDDVVKESPNDNDHLAKSEWHFLKRRTEEKGIKIETEFLADPTLNTVVSRCKAADRIFLETVVDESEWMLEGFRFNTRELLEELKTSNLVVN